MGFQSSFSNTWYLISHSKYSMIDCLLGDAFVVWSCPFWSTVLQCFSAADAHLRLLDHAVSGASFLTGGVFECSNAQRRFVTVLCMLYKIMCYPMYPLFGALPAPYVPVQVTCCVSAAHLYTYAPLRCRTLQDHLTFIPLSVSVERSCWPRSQCCGTGGF